MRHRLTALSSAAFVALGACGDTVTSPAASADWGSTAAFSVASAVGTDYIVIGRGGQLPADLAERVSALGGTVEHVTPQLGMALVRTSDPAALSAISAISGVSAVAPDFAAVAIRPMAEVPMDDLQFGDAVGNPPNSGDNDFFFDLQWGHTAVQAPSAWNLGYRGAGVRVAVLDDGINPNHPDLSTKVNRTLSKSFVPGELYNTPPDKHGTHTSGTIGAADNGTGVIGIAPDAEIVMVKVLSALTGSGSSYNTMAALVYAGDIGAKVINMSLGISVPFPRDGWVTDTRGTSDPEDDVQVHFPAAAYAGFVNLYQDAVNYARDKGAVVIASAGNESIDMQYLGAAIKLPAELPGVVSVSALGPIGWATNSSTSLDVLASYSNFGKSGIDLAAPGGNYDLPDRTAVCSKSYFSAGVLRKVTSRCYAFDGVISTTVGGWGWKFGTSMAAPHVSGVAALIAGKYGSMATPALVEAALRRGADDLGKPGQDEAYGHGRVNALRSLTQ
ncbi:MAG TPA: S8 family serine peptidase [Gemmatimonadaceae bacterium]|nr:S8 family serine peptidase [Gemmatimonadaceae bacterium]